MLALGDVFWASVVTALVALITSGGLVKRFIIRPMRGIERAVNHQGPEQPPLIDRVARIEKSQLESRKYNQWVAASLNKIAKEIGVPLKKGPVNEDEQN